jgi:hypothetical protein
VITLDEMPGWKNYTVPVQTLQNSRTNRNITVNYDHDFLNLILTGASADAVELYNLKGNRIAGLNSSNLCDGTYRISLNGIARGLYIVKVKHADTNIDMERVLVK